MRQPDGLASTSHVLAPVPMQFLHRGGLYRQADSVSTGVSCTSIVVVTGTGEICETLLTPLLTWTYKEGVYRAVVYRLGPRLRQWRKDAGLTQESLAEAIGVEQQTVSDWERNRAQPHYSRAARLDEVFGLPPGTLIAALQETEEGVPVRGAESLDDDHGDPELSFLSGAWPDFSDEQRRALIEVAKQFRRRT